MAFFANARRNGCVRSVHISIPCRKGDKPAARRGIRYNSKDIQPRYERLGYILRLNGVGYRLEGRLEGASIVHTEIITRKMKWIISYITEDSFKWEKLMCDDAGAWNLEGLVYATRKR